MPDRPLASPIIVDYDGDAYWLSCFAVDRDAELGERIHTIAAGDTWPTLAAAVRDHLTRDGCPAAVTYGQAHRLAVDAAKAVLDKKLLLSSPPRHNVEEAFAVALATLRTVCDDGGQDPVAELRALLDRIGDIAYRANFNDPDAAEAALSQIHKMAKQVTK